MHVDYDDHDARIITYCGGGIAASSNAFIMTRLGYTNVAVYTASLQEWSAEPGNPLSTGPD
jgi:thiosulfate/3-mercaptopyruvate sulfurtransferase